MSCSCGSSCRVFVQSPRRARAHRSRVGLAVRGLPNWNAQAIPAQTPDPPAETPEPFHPPHSSVSSHGTRSVRMEHVPFAWNTFRSTPSILSCWRKPLHPDPEGTTLLQIGAKLRACHEASRLQPEWVGRLAKRAKDEERGLVGNYEHFPRELGVFIDVSQKSRSGDLPSFAVPPCPCLHCSC